VTAIDSRARLREAGLYPKKSFGQNFLVTEQVARAIATACVPDAEVGRARVVELGAGLGALTALLAERAAHVVAIERDRDLVPILRATFPEGNVEIVEADAQAFDVVAALGPDGTPRILCGNLPYQITGRLLQLAVNSSASIDRAVFMVQQEVCDRLVAKPSTKEYGALTVFVRAAFDVRRVMNVARGSFHPPPDVTSSVVELTALRPPRALETPVFRAVVKRAFETRRKTLRNSWSSVAPNGDALARAAEIAGVSLDARGETLDVDAFARMAAALEAAPSAQ
jgi:16S rRNA (adenine1518-N6/adenine1519-N6)-dimethyltransferase